MANLACPLINMFFSAPHYLSAFIYSMRWIKHACIPHVICMEIAENVPIIELFIYLVNVNQMVVSKSFIQ